jgi:hypothetical protein
MNASKANILKLLKRASQVEMSFKDYQDFRVLLAKGYDQKIYAHLESSITNKEIRQEFRPSLPFKVPPQMRGDIVLGEGTNNLNRYDSKYAPTHLLGIGATGMGKTVFLVFLLLQYLYIAGGIWIWDFIKREMRGVKRLAEKVGFHAIVCRHENLRINILDPQGTNPSLYANTCSEFITLCLNLPPVARHILKLCVTSLYQKFGLFSDPEALPPILSELIEEVELFEGNKAAKEAILIRLKALLANKSEVLNVRRGMPVSMLSRKIIVWEFDGLETQYQNLFVSYLLVILFTQRVEKRSNELVIAALDEAGRIYSKDAEAANEGPTYIATMTTVIRKMKIALFVWTQSCKNLSNTIIANSGIKVLCQVGSADDYSTFGGAMGLDSREIQWCKTGLDIGKQVIKMNFDWLHPFLNKTPLIEIPEDVTDAEVRDSGRQLLDMIPKTECPRLFLPLPKTVAETIVSSPLTLSPDENNLFNQIKDNPYISSATKYYKMACLSTKRGTIARQALICKNLIKETPLESGKRGAAEAFLEIIPEKSAGKNGGVLHNLLRDKANSWYIWQHCNTQIESTIISGSDHRYVDLAVVWPDGRTEAVEVETEDSARAIENIRKNIAAKTDIISVLTPNSKIRNAIEARVTVEIADEHKNKIKFPTVSYYDQK